MVRKPAVAGTWYPGRADALASEVDSHLSGVPTGLLPGHELLAIVTPHAGIMFSGPVAAWAWRAAAERAPDLIVLVGPSHHVGFPGVSVWPEGAFETPLGAIDVDADAADALLSSCACASIIPEAHAREHSLEMQLPFIKRLIPSARLVPIVMGWQNRDTIEELARALPALCHGRNALIAASTDLSHFFDAQTARRLDTGTAARVEQLDTGGLLAEMERYPEGERGRYVACGAGPMIAALIAARAMGATSAETLRYAHSGDVSGDNTAVVGYLAAAAMRRA